MTEHLYKASKYLNICGEEEPWCQFCDKDLTCEEFYCNRKDLIHICLECYKKGRHKK